MFKFLTQRQSDKDSQKDTEKGSSREPDPKLLARLARQDAADRKGVEDARNRLGAAYQNFLDQLNTAYKVKQAHQRVRVEADYAAWASFYELLKAEFKEAWDFFGVVQADVEGWHRVAPAGDQTSFVAIGREGYSFAAGIEQNSKRGAPFPKKWMTISLGHSTSYLSGIGDERLIGRQDIPEDELCGLDGCSSKSLDEQEKGAQELKKRITMHQLVFTLSSQEHGQHTTTLPVSVLREHSLTELAQKLLIALTNDDIQGLQKLLPTAPPLLLSKQ
jgi:hypothetical protein